MEVLAIFSCIRWEIVCANVLNLGQRESSLNIRQNICMFNRNNNRNNRNLIEISFMAVYGIAEESFIQIFHVSETMKIAEKMKTIC